MAIEIEAARRLAAQRAAVQRIHQALGDAGARPLLVGAGAVAWIADLECSPAWPLRWLVAGDVGAARAVAAAAVGDWGDAVAIPAIAIEPADDDRDQAGNARVFTLGVDAAGEIVDRHGAHADLAAGLLLGRRPWPAWLRGEGERLLELAALAAATGLRPPPEAIAAMRREALHVLSADRKRWAHWLGALLTAARPSVGLQLLQDAGVLPLLLPEVSLLVDFHSTSPAPHKDIFDHTLQVVDKCPPQLIVRWAALMHDVGKVWTRSAGKRGKVQFLRHEELGASLMEGVAGRFHLDPEVAERVCYVIANHARANVYAADWTDSAVRRLVRDMGEHLDAVLAFSRSDFTTKRAWRIREVRELGDELVRRIDELRAADARPSALPKGFGTLVLERTGRRPGPWLGAIQRLFAEEVAAGRLPPSTDAEASWAWLIVNRPELIAAAADEPQGGAPAAVG